MQDYMGAFYCNHICMRMHRQAKDLRALDMIATAAVREVIDALTARGVLPAGTPLRLQRFRDDVHAHSL